jgi:RHH-type rel operon transcriptional repressor/antitoxin RelB
LLLIFVGAAAFYPFPDFDIRLLGIGYHRYFLFHSAILPLLLYAFVRERMRTWSGNFLNGILCAFALGICIHLGIDAFQSKSVAFPFAKTLVKGTLLAVKLDPETEKQLENLARETGRSKSYYVKQALTEFLADRADYLEAMAILERSKHRTPIAQLRKELGLEN